MTEPETTTKSDGLVEAIRGVPLNHRDGEMVTAYRLEDEGLRMMAARVRGWMVRQMPHAIKVDPDPELVDYIDTGYNLALRDVRHALGLDGEKPEGTP